VLGEAPADGAGLLGAEVERKQLLVLVRLPQRRLLLLRDHGEHARDGGAHHLAAREKEAADPRLGFSSPRARGNRNNEEGGGFTEQSSTHILESLLGAPPVTLATRRRESSDLNSLSCACSSALFFARSSGTLIRAAIGRTKMSDPARKTRPGTPASVAKGLTHGD